MNDIEYTFEQIENNVNLLAKIYLIFPFIVVACLIIIIAITISIQKNINIIKIKTKETNEYIKILINSKINDKKDQ